MKPIMSLKIIFRESPAARYNDVIIKYMTSLKTFDVSVCNALV